MTNTCTNNRIKSADMSVTCSVLKYQWLDDGSLLAYWNHCHSVPKTNDLNMTISKVVWMQLSVRVNTKCYMFGLGSGHIVFVWANLYNFLQFHHHDFSWDLVEKTAQVLREYEIIVFSLCFCMGLSVYCEYMHLICCSIEHQRLTPLTALWPSLRSDQTHSVSLSHSQSTLSKNISQTVRVYRTTVTTKTISIFVFLPVKMPKHP